jgi:hypothetical protein
MIHLISAYRGIPICGMPLKRFDISARNEYQANEYINRIKKCSDCFATYPLWLEEIARYEEEHKPTRLERFESWLQMWAYFGESDYDQLPMLAIGVCTLGLGLIPIFGMKHGAKLLLRLRQWRPKK